MSDYTTDQYGYYRLTRKGKRVRPLTFHNGEVYYDAPVFLEIRRQWRRTNTPHYKGGEDL